MYEKQDSIIWAKYIRDIFVSQTITCSQCAIKLLSTEPASRETPAPSQQYKQNAYDFQISKD